MFYEVYNGNNNTIVAQFETDKPESIRVLPPYVLSSVGSDIKFERISVETWGKLISKETQYIPSEMWYEDIELPERKTAGSAGYDFLAPCDLHLKPHSALTFTTGIKCKMPSDRFLALYSRSSLGFKGVHLSGSVCIVDSDYYNNPDNEGVIHCRLVNTSDESITIRRGTAYMQGVIQKYDKVTNDNVVRERTGGLGSTN